MRRRPPASRSRLASALLVAGLIAAIATGLPAFGGQSTPHLVRDAAR